MFQSMTKNHFFIIIFLYFTLTDATITTLKNITPFLQELGYAYSSSHAGLFALQYFVYGLVNCILGLSVYWTLKKSRKWCLIMILMVALRSSLHLLTLTSSSYWDIIYFSFVVGAFSFITVSLWPDLE